MPKVTVLPNVRSVAPRLLAESALIMAFVTVLAGAAFANTLKANCADPSTDLQALIDRANTGDRILISGTCVGHFEVPDQTITLHGLGKNATLDGNNQGVVLNVGNYFGTCCADVKVFGLIVRNGDCGISTAFGSTTTLTNSTVTNNRSWGIETFMGNMTIRSSDIESNGGAGVDRGPGAGGGILNDLMSNMTITHSKVSGNAGVGVYSSQAAIDIKSSTISNNRAGGILNDHSNMTVTNSTVAKNVCRGEGCSEGVGGAGIFNAGTLSLVNSRVVYNSSTNTSYGGGGIFNSPDSSALTITGSTISDNSTDGSGGGIYLYSSSSILDDSLVAHNSAGIDGGGVFINSFGGNFTFTGSDSITRNRAGQDGGGVCDESKAVSVPAGIATRNFPDDFCKP